MTEENSSISDNQLDSMLASLKKDSIEKENKIIDISECDCYDEGCCELNDNPCKSKPNNHCYYRYEQLQKQFARKEQECEELREVLKIYATTTIGELQEDGRYKFTIVNNFDKNIIGKQLIAFYDPTAAQKALKQE